MTVDERMTVDEIAADVPKIFLDTNGATELQELLTEDFTNVDRSEMERFEKFLVENFVKRKRPRFGKMIQN